LEKRDFLLADKTAVVRGVAWESHIELLRDDKTYCISNATCRTYKGEKYLSIGQNCKVTQIEDIGEVVEDDVPETSAIKVVEAEVVTVVTIDTYKSCHNCNGKVQPASNPALFGNCNKCM